jgi:hypothetical protein
MKNLALFFILLVFATGCATPYKPDGLTGGFSETQLDENVFKVSFSGNGYASKERAADFSLLRSAELALEHGYNFFIIVDASEYTKIETHTTPTTYQTKGKVNHYNYNSTYNATTRSFGGETYTTSKPRATNTIVCYKEKPVVNGMVYNAAFINKSIKEKYDIKEYKENRDFDDSESTGVALISDDE